MPLYEQKLVSPLALRFTQEHIRTTFRDGREVEASITEITSLPGRADYDVILNAPFPVIEILRWEAPNHVHPSARSPCLACEREKKNHRCEHWFTLDNRRLYCLQRAALALWPQHVAVVVDLLYADPGKVWKKYDSTTYGQAVSIGHLSKGPVIKEWDWRITVMQTMAESLDVQAALRRIEVHDEQECSNHLENAPDEEGTSLMASVYADVLRQDAVKATTPSVGCSTPSTADSSDWRDNAESKLPPSSQELLVLAVKKGLSGMWKGGLGETYHFNFKTDWCWSCERSDATGSKTFNVVFDVSSGTIWWGTGWSYYFSASEVVQQPDRLGMYAVGSGATRPRFVWMKLPDSAQAGLTMQDAGNDAQVPGGANSSVNGAKVVAGGCARPKGLASNPSVLESEAISEIERQLQAPANRGYVRIQEWNSYFLPQLGSLRGFLERHPERFVVKAAGDRRYTVALASSTRSVQESSQRALYFYRKACRAGPCS